MEKSEEEITNDAKSWIKSRWRPIMAWQYMAVCLFDFVAAPILQMAFFRDAGGAYIQWVPLTLESNGFYHLAMLAILGVTAWSRGQEKLAGIER